MVQDGFHPEKIAESAQGPEIEIMEDRHVLSQVDDLVMQEAADMFYLELQVFQILFVAVVIQVNPDRFKQGASFSHIQDLVERKTKMPAEFPRLVEYQGSVTPYATISAVVADVKDLSHGVNH
jgi:hypothetical protein